jgi:hypothetical protein
MRQQSLSGKMKAFMTHLQQIICILQRFIQNQPNAYCTVFRGLRYPIVRANLLADQLRRQLRKEERTIKYRLSIIIIIGVHTKILWKLQSAYHRTQICSISHFQLTQHIVRQRLNDIAPIKLQGKKHDASPKAYLPVQLY